jgi:hypothetical protein
MMANAAKSTVQKPPTSKAPAKAPAPPPAKASRIYKGVIERYEHGQLVSTEPAPTPPAAQAPAKLSQKAAPATTAAPAAPPPPASIATPRDAQNSEHVVAKLGSEDIWSFRLVNPQDPSQGVTVTHYQGYRVMSRNTHKTARADQLYHEMLAKGLVYVDGQVHRLVDEDI